LNVVQFLTNIGPFFWTTPAIIGAVKGTPFHHAPLFLQPRAAGCFGEATHAVDAVNK
jgi:hypothetical protein